MSSLSKALHRCPTLRVTAVSPPTIGCGADGREKHKAAAALLKKSRGRKGFRQPRIAPRQNAYRRELKASEVLSVIRLAREQCRPARGLRDWPRTRLGTKSNVGEGTVRDFETGRVSPLSTSSSQIGRWRWQASPRWVMARLPWRPGVQLTTQPAPGYFGWRNRHHRKQRGDQALGLVHTLVIAAIFKRPATIDDIHGRVFFSCLVVERGGF